MNAAKLFMHLYAGISLAVVVAGSGVDADGVPPLSMFADRDGVPHFTPQVENPVTGEGISVNELIKHYRGD